MNFSNFESQISDLRSEMGTLRLLSAFLIRDLLEHDRQVAGHAIDCGRDALRGRIDQEHQLADQFFLRWQRSQGVNVFNIDYAAFDNAGFECELSVLLGELAQ